MSVGLRNKRIDLIRGVSILLVLFHHLNIAYRLSGQLLPDLQPTMVSHGQRAW